MNDILAQILANTRTEVAQARADRPADVLRQTRGYQAPRRNFYGAVVVPHRGRPNLIAEIKRSSPSAGVIRPDLDPVAIACMYHEAGAAALSILTDRKHFDGRLEYIEAAKAAMPLPVLRKDFIIDAYQVYESRAYGADAILLIAEALPAAELAALAGLAHELELAVLVEVHTTEALRGVLTAIPLGLRPHLLLGINNRDLKAQRVDLATTERVAEHAPPGLPIVSESGIRTRQDVQRLHHAGARALLIGETLLRAPDPRAAIRALFA